MSHQVPYARRAVRGWALALGVVALAGCGGGDGGGTADFTQKFDAPPDAVLSEPIPKSEIKTRRQQMQEDRAEDEAKGASRR